MVRDRVAFRSTFGALVLTTALANLAPGQQAVPSAGGFRPADIPEQRPEVVMARALRSNPLTAPYAIGVAWQDGKLVLAGRVGTKQVHDAAVQMAIAFGLRFRDDLVIDTAETMRVAMSATPSMTGYGALAPPVGLELPDSLPPLGLAPLPADDFSSGAAPPEEPDSLEASLLVDSSSPPSLLDVSPVPPSAPLPVVFVAVADVEVVCTAAFSALVSAGGVMFGVLLGTASETLLLPHAARDRTSAAARPASVGRISGTWRRPRAVPCASRTSGSR